ncbi:MAG: hypothetical protein P1V36_14160, partial [Planctomycetota bacterium]|nr:hypothetical protein [Planctomycetota bacterium]
VAAAAGARPQAADAEALAMARGATLEDPAVFVRSLPTMQRTERTPRWPLFLWLAVLLLPFDVYLHRRDRSA